MSATHAVHSTPTAGPVLYVAFELSWGTWKMAFTVGAGQPPRIRTVPARCTSLVLDEIKKAKLRFGLPVDAPVVSCYEAGRDGFWIHRFLAPPGDSEHRRRLRVDRGQPAQAPSQIGSPRRRQAGVDAHSLAQRREESLERGPCSHRRRRGSPAAPSRVDRAQGRANRAAPTGSRACWPDWA